MNVNFINPFISATIHVLDTMVSASVAPGKPFLKKNNIAMGDVTAIIGLTGEARGTISVSFTEQSILSIVTKMFGEEAKELNEEIRDAVGEISNMISGHARQSLEKMGKSMTAAIPTVIMGKKHTISHITHYPVIAIPFNTDHGGFTIEVCLEE